MIQKIILISFCSAFSIISLNTNAQVKNETVTSQLLKDDQMLIKEALAGSIFIIRQDYILKSTNTANSKEYGKGSNPYFGRMYGFGVLCIKKMWTDIKFKTPWIYDKNYIESEKSDTMKPVLSSLAVKAPSDSVFMQKKYTIKTDTIVSKDTSKQHILLGAKTIFAYDIIIDSAQKTVRTDKINRKDSTGWLVIAYTNSDFYKNDSLTVNTGVYKTTLHFNDSTGEAAINKMPVTDNIIGGAFFKTIIYPGKIEVVFSGILVKKVLHWYVVQPPKSIANSQKKTGNSLKANNMNGGDSDNKQKNK
ncbi:MAG: hypothetical protein V1904_06735 [Bacteroidota bacterium]